MINGSWTDARKHIFPRSEQGRSTGTHIETLTRLSVRADLLTLALWKAYVVELEFTSQLRWFEHKSIEDDFLSAVMSLVSSIALLCKLDIIILTFTTGQSDILFEHAFFELKTLPLMFVCIAAPYMHDPSISDDAEQELCNRLLEHAVVALPRLRYLALGQMPERRRIRTRWRWWRFIRHIERIEVREVPAWEGERVREYMRDADGASADAFDGKSSSRFTFITALIWLDRRSKTDSKPFVRQQSPLRTT